MPTLAEVRTQYPQYQDMSDQALADALHSKFYADMPRGDFDKKIGVTPNESVTTGTFGDVAKSGSIGLAEGAIGLAGLPADMRSLAASGVRWAADKLGAQDVVGALDALRAIGGDGATSKAIQSKIEEKTGQFYQPQTTAGEYARTVGQFVPAAAIPGGGGLGARVATAVTGGLGSEFAGQMTKGTSAEPYARIAGGVIGGLAPSAMRGVVTPIPSNPERERLVQVLQGEGVNSITAGQRTGSNALRYLESALGDAPGAGGGAQGAMSNAREQFTQAALRRAGSNGQLATPEVMAANQNRLANNFRDLAARNDLTPDNQFIGDIVNAARNYRRVPDSQQRAMVQGYIDDIAAHVNNGRMPGPMYQEMRSRLSRQSNSLRQSDPTLSEALRDMRVALDNAMERSIPAQSGDAQLWQQTRREYAAQKTLEKAASKAGEATGEGVIVPANLRNTVAAENRGAYARGQGDFADLTRAGATVLTQMPQSGTGPRLMAQGIPAAIGSAIMGGTGLAAGGVGGGMAGATLGATLGPAIAGRALMSRPVQAYLGNQLLNGPRNSREAAARALLQSVVSQQLQYQPR